MSNWHLGPMCGFDLETTGTDPESARIVTAAVVIRGTDYGDFTQGWLADPGIEIPAAAAAVHGITTGRARAEGMESGLVVNEVMTALTEAMTSGVPLVIYNAPYDLTLLDREARRHGLTPFGDIFADELGHVIDPLVLDKHADPYRKGKRTLTAACEHYRVALDGAHDATADAIAAMRVAWRIGTLYPDLAAMDLAGLHDLQVKARAGQAASFAEYLRKQGKDEVVDGAWPMRAAGVSVDA